MGLKTYLYAVGLLVHVRQGCQDNCMLTNMCPLTKERWTQRAKTFNCTERDTNYTCLLNEENQLVETCMYEITVGKDIAGCPYITTCEDEHPLLGAEGEYRECPENILGCPKRNHKPYSIYEMYKYPACFYSNKYKYAFLNILPTTTHFDVTYNSYKTQLPTKEQSCSAPVGLIITVAVLATVVLGIAVMVFIKCCLRRKRGCLRRKRGCLRRKRGCLRRKREESHSVEKDNDRTDLKQSFQDFEVQLLLPCSGHVFYQKLKEKLLEISKYAVESFSLSSLQNICKRPKELLFSKVIIKTQNKRSDPNEEMLYTRMKKDTEVSDPNDLFLLNGEPTRRIFMKGGVAHGKTAYCLWLLQHWLNAQVCIGDTKAVNNRESAIGQFEFVFFIQLSDVEKSRATVIDMICYDVLKITDKAYFKWVQNALKTGQFHSLIIIDGLEEWKPDQDVTRHSNFKGMPVIDDIKNCVMFITMRPGKFNSVVKKAQTHDLVTEIIGLDKEEIKLTTANVLANYYGLDIKSTDKHTYDDIIEKIENNTLGSIMCIPFLAITCIQIWLKGEEVGKSMTRFYIEIIGILIERAQKKHKFDTMPETHNDVAKSHFEASLCKHTIVSKYISVLKRLGKLAYSGLLSDDFSSTFYADKLGDELGMTDTELDFSLNVGLLSREELDSTLTKVVKVYFFHRSVQEFLGAVYLTDNEDIRRSFCEHLSSIEVIMKFENVLTFMSGLNPAVGSCMSQHMVSISNSNAGICARRQCQTIFLLSKSDVMMYKLQVSCYKEFAYTQKGTGNMQQTVPYHVSDVHVFFNSDKKVIKATADILVNHHTDIKFLSMHAVSNRADDGIPDNVLTIFFDRTAELQSLHIDGYKTYRTLYEISARFSSLTALVLINVRLKFKAIKTLQSLLQSNRVIETLGLEFISCLANEDDDDKPASLSGLIQILPELPRLSSLRIQLSNQEEKTVFCEVMSRLCHLKSIRYHHTLPEDDAFDSIVVQHICNWTGLHWLFLGCINLNDRGLQLSSDMKSLKALVLDGVTMSNTDWSRFIQAINNIEKIINVILRSVNIDEENRSMVRSSEHCLVTCDEVDDKGNQNFEFTRVWPPSVRSQYYTDLLFKCLRNEDFY